MTALVILLRASSALVLSPPAVIHCMPPKIRKAKTKTAAISITTFKMELNILPKSVAYPVPGLISISSKAAMAIFIGTSNPLKALAEAKANFLIDFIKVSF